MPLKLNSYFNMFVLALSPYCFHGFSDSLIQNPRCLSDRPHRLPVIHLNGQPKGKEGRRVLCVLWAFEKTYNCPRYGFVTCKSMRKEKLQTSRGWALFKKEYPISVAVAELEEFPCNPACHWLCSNQVKGKILAKQMNAPVEHTNRSKCRDRFLKWVKENDQKQKGSTEAPACSTQRSTPCENQWKEA